MERRSESAPQPVSTLEIKSSSSVSPVGKGGPGIKNTNDGYSPTATTVAETPSPSNGSNTGSMALPSPFSPNIQVTKLDVSPEQLHEQPRETCKSTNPFDDSDDEEEVYIISEQEANSPSPAKPFDEAVDDSNGNFEDVWASAEIDEDRMYLFSKMMMTELPEQSKELPSKEQSKKIPLPFVCPDGPTSSSINKHSNSMDILASMQEKSELRSLAESPYSLNTPCTLEDNDRAIDSMTESPNLIVLTPTTPDEMNTTGAYSMKPHTLFHWGALEEANKENIPPHFSRKYRDDDSAKTPEDEPGKLVPTSHIPKKKVKESLSPKSDDDMPWDCVDEYAAYYEGEIRQLKKMELQQLRDLEEGMDNPSRRSVLQDVFKKEPKTFKTSKQVEAQERMKSMRKLSSIHPPEIIEFEIKKNRSNDSSKDVFEDEPLASLSLAAGDTGYEGLDRALVDPPRFPIRCSPQKSVKKDLFSARRASRRWVLKACLCVSLGILIASAVIVALYTSGNLSTNDTVPVNWEGETGGQLFPVDDEETAAPQYTPESNLFEGDEIIACTNAEVITKMDQPHFGSTWKSFWDSRINTCGDQTSTGYSIWYTYTPEVSSLVEASTCNNADFDTQITVLSGNCGELNCISFNDEACGSQSKVIWYAEADTTYYLMISGYREASGTFGLTLTQTVHNDDCFDAIGPIVPGSVVAGTTAGAQNLALPPKCGDVDMTAPGVWYEVANVTGFYRAEVLKGYTDFSGQVSVYRSMDDLDLGCGALLCTAFSTNGNVTWLAEGKETYYVFVNGFNGTMGDFDLFFGLNTPSTCKQAKRLDANTIGYLASTEAANPQNVESCGYTGYHTAPGLWFSVEGTGAVLEVSTCGSLQTLDTQISVFGEGCDSLRCIGGTGQDYPCGDNGSVSWKTQEGEVYHIFVSGRSSRVGDFVLDIKEKQQENGYSCPTSLALELGSGSYQSSTINSPSSAVNLCGLSGAVRGAWHELLGTGTTVKISVCNDDTDFDARVSLYHGSCNDLTCMAHTQSRCGENDEILVTTHAGQLYYIFVHGPDSFSIGNYRLDIDESIINDSCHAASPIELSPGRYFGSTRSARLSVSAECGASNTDSVALWYRMLGTGGTATISTCSEITDFTSDVTVFSGSCGSLSCVRDTGTKCGNQTSLSFQTIEDEVYYVRVGGNTTLDRGNFIMDVTDMTPFFGSG
ncbi:hypothetical protein IV203_026438 [Nitzschia inconspicua]|uniref:Uncharacterized protein n=1 Tax=Nitzschia inconspicua TaxID=303405 RepID=A0A9K3LJY5_9STRA|nr:hypothetical protein IV203_026438 [Nitzschia inconspicua]